MNNPESQPGESGPPRRRFPSAVVWLVPLVVGAPVGWMGGRAYKVWQWSQCHHGVLMKIDSLADQRPANITPEHWDEAVGWGRTAFCNLWSWNQDNLPQLRDFSEALSEKIEAGDSLATLRWVWDQLERQSEAGPRYAATWKPVRAMNANPITDANVGQLWGLAECVHLDLSDTKVGDSSVKQLIGSHNLVSLNLSRTMITDHGLAELAYLRQLQNLRLTGVNVTDAAVQKFPQALPNCEIER